MSLRIAIIGNAMSTMVNFRAPLIRALVQSGHEVIAICPKGRAEDTVALAGTGARHVSLEGMSPRGLSPASEIRVLRHLTALLHDIRPDRVFAYFLKPVIWGSIAARRSGVPRCVGMIEGLGYAFSLPPAGRLRKLRQGLARLAILALLKVALRKIDHLIVLNRDDASLLLSYRLVSAARLTVLDGIGIDLDFYAPAPSHSSPVRFLLAARLIREKGIELFVAAAREVRKQYPDVRFRLLGGLDTQTEGLTVPLIESWVDEGLIEWPGQAEDVRPHLRESSVFVLPTLYREGLPRSTMEAMAMGRAVITSDMPGAKSSMTHGVSGLIVPAGNLDALVAACRFFCRTPSEIERMGLEAYAEAHRRYDLRRQNYQQIELIVNSTNKDDD